MYAKMWLNYFQPSETLSQEGTNCANNTVFDTVPLMFSPAAFRLRAPVSAGEMDAMNYWWVEKQVWKFPLIGA